MSGWQIGGRTAADVFGEGSEPTHEQLADFTVKAAAISPPPPLKDVEQYVDVREDPDFEPAPPGWRPNVPDGDDVHAAADGRKPSAADLIVKLAVSRYDLGRSADGEPFAIEREGPNVARMFRGGRASLRANLAARYAQQTGKVPPAQALVDALAVLEGRALGAERRPLPLRAIRHDDQVIIDVGDEAGRAIVVTVDGWHIESRSPVTFRRSELTAPLPTPAPAGDVNLLFSLLNVAKEDQPVILAYQVAALLGVPVPIVLFRGPAGAAKTSAARALARVIDPSPAPVRSAPRDPESWAVTAGGSYVVVLDNLTTISDWLSDALCRAVTGEGFLRRALYSDSAISVVAFRRALMLTAIDAGAVRGDLADRLCAIDLAEIGEQARRDEDEIEADFRRHHPAILAGLLDLLVNVLRALPTIRLERRPRMADFGRVLRAVDLERGTDGLARYMEQRGELQREAAEGDRIGATIIGWMAGRDEWSGTSADLLAELTPERPPKDWPATPRALAGALRRVAQPLKAAGIVVAFTRETGSGGRRLVSLRTELQPTVATVAPSQILSAAGDGSDGSDPHDPPTVAGSEHDGDGRDGSDGRLHTLSGWDEDLAERAADGDLIAEARRIFGDDLVEGKATGFEQFRAEAGTDAAWRRAGDA